MTPAFSLSLSLSLLLRPRSASSSIDTVSRPYGRTPTRPCEIPKANKRSNAKKHLFPILYLTLPAFLPFSILVSPRSFLPMHTRVLGVPASHACTRGPAHRSRFYCCRKLMRSRGDTTDIAGRAVQLAARSFGLGARTLASIKRYPSGRGSQSTSTRYTLKRADWLVEKSCVNPTQLMS